MAKHLRSNSLATPSWSNHGGGGEEQPERDFISHLPDSILHLILSKLEIRDAAVTTAVAKRWASLFPTLPCLKIDSDSFNPRDPDAHDKLCFNVENPNEWVDALFSVLDSRREPVKKFEIGVEILDWYKDEFYEVFREVCKAGVEELVINNDKHDDLYYIPSPVFSCQTIVKLEFSFCRLAVPSKLTGLRAVKSLVLSNVSVEDTDLRRLISRCKGMQKLVITECFRVTDIVIRAPNLLELEICLPKLASISLKSTPRLISVQVSFAYNYGFWKRYDMLHGGGGIDFNEFGQDTLTFNLDKFEEAFMGRNVTASLIAFLNRLSSVKNVHLEFNNMFRMVFF